MIWLGVKELRLVLEIRSEMSAFIAETRSEMVHERIL